MDYEDLLGKPFEIGGHGESYDCYTLSREVCRRAGIDLPDKKSIEDLQTRSDAINQGKKEDYIKLDKPEPFCIVTFSLRPPFVNHMGVVLEDRKTFIHILEKRSVVVEKLRHKFWNSKIEGFYRFVGENNAGKNDNN